MLINADATALPLEDNSFDVASASHILYLTADSQTALDELRRVLKPAGIFIYFHHLNNKTATRDALYPRALADLEAWVEQEFPDPNMPTISSDRTTVTAADNWAC